MRVLRSVDIRPPYHRLALAVECQKMKKRDPEQVRLAMQADQVAGGIVDLAVYLQQGGDPNVRVGPRRDPLLHVAFETLRLEPLELLRQAGSDIDAADSEGRTLLHLAVETDVDGSVQNDWPLTMAWTRLVLRLGADATRRDLEGRTPGDDAQRWGGPTAAHAYGRALKEARPPDRHREAGPD